jgi:transposase InsO family protein
MNIHKRARLTPIRREEMARLVVSGQLSKAEAGRRFDVSVKTVSRWTERYRQAGQPAMMDRSSRPHHSPRRIAQALERAIIGLRRQRLCGAHIAVQMGVSAATVSRVLKRAGLSRMKDLDPIEPQRRYEYKKPGEMIHLDIKKLGRFNRTGHRITGDRKGQSNQRANGTAPGWEYVHVCIDDHSRLSFSQIHTDEKAVSAVAHFKAAVAWYKRLGITVSRVMTDNGACYKSKDFAKACRDLGIRHIRTKPYTPRTNGKAERFIQTALREWAYARPYETSDQRAGQLESWQHMYNWHRPHGGINNQTPISRSGMNRNNLLRFHT